QLLARAAGLQAQGRGALLEVQRPRPGREEPTRGAGAGRCQGGDARRLGRAPDHRPAKRGDLPLRAGLTAAARARLLPGHAPRGFRPKAPGSCWKVSGPGPDAKSPLGEPEQVGARESTFDASAGSLTIAPASVEIYHFERA